MKEEQPSKTGQPGIAGYAVTLPMKLPNAANAIAEREKVTGYLLNSEHRSGAGKAKFFMSFGFSFELWEQLADALLEHGRTHDVATVRETGFGPRFSVEGPLNTPDGRRPNVRSVWQLDEGMVAPRLITAYPLDEVS